MRSDTPCDVFIIGGGANGCGIARDAAGRGLAVTLAEMGDLGWATSSASTKLIHGGLRYLEYLDLGLVRAALRERELLLGAMPHIIWPLRFVLPFDAGLRVAGDAPVARLLARVLPWRGGRRPAWLIRLGLFLYDHLGGRRLLPASRSLDLRGSPEGAPLHPRLVRGFEYSDCWVQDSRLVLLNARDAARRGAEILVRTQVLSARPEGGLWRIETRSPEGVHRLHRARVLVNAAGPWVADVVRRVLHRDPPAAVRLVRGSHIVTRRLYRHDKAYLLPGRDGRIVFALPFEGDFTLIGTTEAAHDSPSTPAVCTEAEMDYLCARVSDWFRTPVTRADVVWSFAGVRGLVEDGAASATAATRDYLLTLDREGPPLLGVFGGKITTYRRLAEDAVARIAPLLGAPEKGWTAGVPLPGGDFPVGAAATGVEALRRAHPFLSEAEAWRLFRTYGTEAGAILQGADAAGDMGQAFGAGITARELAWSARHEWTRTAEDFLWRRTRLGLRTTAEEAAAIDEFLARRRAKDAV